MERLENIVSNVIPIPRVNCDTDQIIPARFLQKPRSDNFGRYLFADERFDKDGRERPDNLFNQPVYGQARIVLGGRNFGCGSSREHAVWALYDFGIRAVIAPSFGDIFTNNSLKNGLLPVVLPEEAVTVIAMRAADHPAERITVDLLEQCVRLHDGSRHRFDVDPFAKHCLVNGIDELSYTLGQADLIDRFENSHSTTQVGTRTGGSQCS
jgi:3-isopropylmalate/(R)-2-methylmalate dehydratase small subunit